MIEVALVVLGIAAFIGLIVWSVVADYRAAVKKEQEIEAKYQADKAEFIRIESARPKYCIKFVSMDGLTYKSYPIEPICSRVYRDTFIGYTSAECAAEVLKKSYERGHFTDELGVTHPVHRIYSAEVAVW